jgi:hypothetical protein
VRKIWCLDLFNSNLLLCSPVLFVCAEYIFVLSYVTFL